MSPFKLQDPNEPVTIDPEVPGTSTLSVEEANVSDKRRTES